MKVKLFDEAHEKDLESAINEFIEETEDIEIVDIKFGVSCSMYSEEQINCFSAMVLYRKKISAVEKPKKKWLLLTRYVEKWK